MIGNDNKNVSQNPPAVILVRPQMGENIGAAARVMGNFGLRDLRLVSPRDGWPNARATDMARNASNIIEEARIFETVEEAVEDIHFLYAATARPREMIKPVITPKEMAIDIKAQSMKCGFLFGPEKTGLENKDIILSDAIVTIPVHPGYTSLNLAQSVAVFCYEYYTTDHSEIETPPAMEKMPAASKKEISAFLGHLEHLLDTHNFFKVPEKR